MIQLSALEQDTLSPIHYKHSFVALQRYTFIPVILKADFAKLWIQKHEAHVIYKLYGDMLAISTAVIAIYRQYCIQK